MSTRLVVPALVLTALCSSWASTPVAGQAMGIREVSASARSLTPLQTRLRYTTMIVLPEGEEILDVVCGDKDFWVISAAQNIAHVKPAKEGASTNLNLVTASGTVYSFLLTEKNSGGTPDLKVYERGDPVLEATLSPVLRDAIERRSGRIEHHVFVALLVDEQRSAAAPVPS